MASRPIDEKIVVMTLENSDFKRKAAETTSIFGKLKSVFNKTGESTNLKNVTKDLGDIQRAADKVNLSRMSASVDQIASRFSNLGVVATTALTNITNKAVNAGTALIDSLTTEQVRSGFNEYELKMRSIGTMLSNTEWAGSTLEDVKKTLAELNDYADNTIYSFAEMTSSIGRFTAAGVTLEDSAIAIKGLGNLAAASGSTVDQLNTAMYQVSQGLSAGRFGLEDWNSMINAGMGGKKTKDALMATAKAMGKNIDLSKGFNLSLQQGWLTTDVFLETLKQFGEDDSMTEAATSVRTLTGMLDSLKEGIGSGWAQTWELIFGDYEQATRFWTGLSNIVKGFFEKSTAARNNLLIGLIDSGVLELFGGLVRGVFTPIIQLFKALGSAFSAIFPSSPPVGLLYVIGSMAELTSNFKMSAKTMESVKTIFQGLFSIIAIGVSVLQILVGSLFALVPGFTGAGGGVADFLAKLAGIPIAINDYINSSELVQKVTSKVQSIFSSLGGVIAFVGDAFRSTAAFISQASSILSSGDFTEGLVSEDSKVVTALLKLREVFGGLFDYLGSFSLAGIGAGITSFFDGIGNTVDWVKEKISSAISFFSNLGSTIADNQGWILAGGGLAATAAIIWKVYETISGVLNITGNFAETLEGVSDALGAFTLGIHAKSLLAIAMAVGVLAVSLKLLSGLNGKQIATSLTAVVVSLTALVGALAVINKYDLSGSIGAISALIGIAGAVALLSIAVSNLASLETDEAIRGVGSVVALVAALAGAMTLMSKFGAVFTVGATQLVAIGLAIGIMAFAVEKIVSLNPDEIGDGLQTLAILLAELAIFLRLASSQSATLTASGLSIVAISASMLIMVAAIKQLGAIDPSILGQGLATIATLLTGIGLLSKVTNGTSILSTSAAMVVLAGAMTAMIIPIKQLGTMQWETLVIGITAIVTTLGLLAAIVTKMTASLAGAAALVVIAGALNLLIIPIKALGAMQWEHLLQGILGLAGGLLAFGGVAAILGALSPALIALSVSVGIFGLGLLAAGAGLTLFGKGMLIMSTLTVGAFAVIGTAVGAFITAFTALLPALTDLGIKVANSISEMMKEAAPKMADAFGTIMVSLFEKIKEYSPQLSELLLQTIEAMLEKLDEYIPKFVDIVEEMMLEIAQSIADHSLDILDVIEETVLSMLDSLNDFVPKFIESGANLIIGFLDGLGEHIPRVIDAMVENTLAIINGMTEALRENGSQLPGAMLELMGEVLLIVIEAGVDLVTAMFGWIPGVTKAATAIGENAEEYIRQNFSAKDLGTEKGGEFADSLSTTSESSQNAGNILANSAMDGAKSVDASSAGTWFGEGFIQGMSGDGIMSRVWSAATNLASKAYNAIKERLDINSPSGEGMALGGYTGEGFAIGLSSSGKSVMEALLGWEKPATKAVDKVSKSVETKSQTAGANSAKSMATGVKKGTAKQTKSVVKSVEDVAAKAADAFNEKLEEIDYKLEIGEIDISQQVTQLKALRDEYSKYPELVKKATIEIKKAEKDLFDSRLDDIDYKLEIGEINVSQQVEDLRKLRDEYSENNELYKKANLELKKAEEDLTKFKEEQLKKEYELAKKVIEEKRELNQMSMRQEIDAYIELRELYEENSEMYIQADEDAARVRKELKQELTKVNQDYVDSVQETHKELIESEKELNDEYNKTYSERRSDLINFAGTFDEISKESEITGAQLVSNLSGQVNAFKEWQTQIGDLSSKAIDQGLIAELREMGPKALNEIRALNALSETELQKYSDLYAEKARLATEETDKEMAPMKADLEKNIEALRKTSATKLDQLRDTWKGKIKELTSATQSEMMGLHRIGNDAIDGLINGLNAKKGELQATAAEIGAIVDQAVRKELKIKSPSRVMKTIGGYVMDGMIVGIANKSKDVIDKVTSIARGIADAFANKQYTPVLDSWGDDVSVDTKAFISNYNDVIIQGTLSSEERRLEIVERYAQKRKEVELANAEEIAEKRRQYAEEAETRHDYNDEDKRLYVDGMMGYAGKDISEKYSNVFIDLYHQEQAELQILSQARAKAFKAQKDLIKHAKEMYKISVADEYGLYSEFEQMYAKDSEEYKYFNGLKVEYAKKMFDSEKAIIDKRKKYNRISLLEELRDYEKYVNAWVEGSEERLYYEEKIAETKKAIHDKLIDLNNDYTSKINTLNDDLVEAESEAAKEIEEARISTTKKASEEMLKAREDYNKKVKDLNEKSAEDEKAIFEEYDNAVKEQTRSLTNFVGIFDKIERKSGVSGKRLMRNLQNQVLTFKNWRTNIESLSAKGIDQNLLAELRAMGPSAASEIAGLNRLSSSQLSEYSSIWREKSELAKNEAVYQLQDMKVETLNKVDTLRQETASKLDEYAREWQATNARITAETTAELEELTAEVNTNLDKIRNDTNTKLEQYTAEWESSISKIKDVTTGVFNAMTATMPEIGENVIEGLEAGLSNATSSLFDKVKGIATGIGDTIRRTLNINSPSKVTEDLGEWTGQGLVNGIISKTKNIIGASKDIALSAKDSLNQFLEGFSVPKDSEELRFKVVVEYDPISATDLVKMNTLAVEPDLSYSRESVSVARSSAMRQNANVYDVKKPEPSQATQQETLQPININATLQMDSKVVATETFTHTNRILGNVVNNKMRYMGVRTN